MGSERLKVAMAIACQSAAARANPKVALTVHQQTENKVVPQFGCVSFVEDREAIAIEARQAFLRAEPHITVGGLAHRHNGVVRQP